MTLRPMQFFMFLRHRAASTHVPFPTPRMEGPLELRLAQLWLDDAHKSEYALHFRDYAHLNEKVGRYVANHGIGNYDVFLRGSALIIDEDGLLPFGPVDLHMKQVLPGERLPPRRRKLSTPT